MNFSVYILECADGTYYVGYSKDWEKRLYAHNHLKSGARYTKSRRPVEIVYLELFETAREARQREYHLKQLKRKDKIRVMNGALL